MENPRANRLKGDLAAQGRYAAFVEALGGPHNDTEAELLVMLSRLLSNGEVATLLVLLIRKIEKKG
jgi:hypothetical protein